MKQQTIIFIILFIGIQPIFSLVEYKTNIYPISVSRLPPKDLYSKNIFESEYSGVEVILYMDSKLVYQMSYNSEGLIKQYKYTYFDNNNIVIESFIYSFNYSGTQLVNCTYNGEDIYEIQEIQDDNILSFSIIEPYSYYESNNENAHQRFDSEYHIDFSILYENGAIKSINGKYQEDYILEIQGYLLKQENQFIDYNFIDGYLDNIKHNYRGFIDSYWYKYNQDHELIEVIEDSGSKRINRYSNGLPIYYEFIGNGESLRRTTYSYKYDQLNRVISVIKKDDIIGLEVENTFNYSSENNCNVRIWDEHRKEFIEMDINYIQ